MAVSSAGKAMRLDFRGHRHGCVPQRLTRVRRPDRRSPRLTSANMLRLPAKRCTIRAPFTPRPRSEKVMKLKDKTAIITGAASGIGKDIALRFAREGAKVAIADLKKEAADAAAKEIRAFKGTAIGIAMDVRNEQAVNDGVAAVVAEFGGVDILVSNAGIQIVHP